MRRSRIGLFGPWLVWATLCVVAMWSLPGKETVPYHLGYAGLAVAFGLDVWTNRRVYLALGGFTVATGQVLLTRADAGVIDWGETAEIPLMCAMMALMIWHVSDRNAALARATHLAEREHDQGVRRERMVRLTSHEMRTPLTIATGYVDLLRAGARDVETDADLEIVHHELDRLSRSCDRLLRMLSRHEQVPVTPVDVDLLLARLGERWRVVAPRDWQVDAAAGVAVCNEERLGVCLDTLVENAVRYTAPGETIRVFGRRHAGELSVGVADGGCGFDEHQICAVNDPGELLSQEPGPADDKSQTGLGLSLVRELVETSGGSLLAGKAPEGGALLVLRIPVSPGAGPTRRSGPQPVVRRSAELSRRAAPQP